MLLDIVIIIIGIYIVLKGADLLTEGAVSLAQRMNMPEMLIGLTVVAVGTSMPEFFVSVTSALLGTTDLAVANVVGSNIFNVLLIAGVSAVVSPMVISRSTVRRDIPVAVMASLILLGFGIYGSISRAAGILFLALLVAYTIYAICTASPDESQMTGRKPYTLLGAIGRIVIGLTGLVVGSDCFVSSATEVAGMLGISEAVIGLTIVAGGTSLPELATSVVAARKGQSSIAIGNVIGSCVYNILLIIGVTGIITPMTIEGLSILDFALMMASITLLWLFSFTKYKVERWEGWLMIAIFACYLAWLVCNA
ncbi:MAG: calcium/sodium antiporter [Prevotella sp.]|nr:calcium/sodium antiporter [Prevotella sp.]